jgi:formylglycine-generating enzyme required for sulfatase activity
MRLSTQNFFGGLKWLPPAICGLALFAAVLPGLELEKSLAVDLGGGVKMEFVLIPAGSFIMGSETGDADEKPLHKVIITKPFYISKYEVTQEQWQAVMGANPSRSKGPKNPVDMVNWLDCQKFIEKLKTRVDGLRPSLPTEAQWEYACRAGSTSEYYFGPDSAALGRYAWYGGNSEATTHPVGRKEPNAWGLYDMSGNVYEWCGDAYDDEYYAHSPVQDPRGPDSGSVRILRGGSWCLNTPSCRSAFRAKNSPSFRFEGYGFRPVLEIP